MIEGYIGDATPGFDNERRPQPAAERRHRAATPRRASSSTRRSGSSTRRCSSRSPATRPRRPTPAPARRSTVDAARTPFTRSDGGSASSLDGFQVAGMVIFAFGFANAANQGTSHPVDRTVTRSTTRSRRYGRGDTHARERDVGDEALVVRGDRGPLLDLIFILQRLGRRRQLASLGGRAGADLRRRSSARSLRCSDDGDPANDPSAGDDRRARPRLPRAAGPPTSTRASATGASSASRRRWRCSTPTPSATGRTSSRSTRAATPTRARRRGRRRAPRRRPRPARRPQPRRQPRRLVPHEPRHADARPAAHPRSVPQRDRQISVGCSTIWCCRPCASSSCRSARSSALRRRR